MKRTIRDLLVLVIVVLNALPVQAASAAQGPCLAAPSVAIRQGPGGGYRSAGYLSRGQCITVHGWSADGQWYQISQGWVWAAPHLWTAAGSQLASSGGPSSTAGAAAGAPVVTAETWVSDRAPEPSTEIVAYVLIHVDGAPRAGIPVQFAWQFGTGTELCARVTDADGLAACLRNVGDVASQQIVLIKGTFRAYGRNYAMTTSFAPNGNCEPAYPDSCLQRGLPRLECRDIPYSNFQVLPPDPHGFDGDGNGIGCEQ